MSYAPAGICWVASTHRAVGLPGGAIVVTTDQGTAVFRGASEPRIDAGPMVEPRSLPSFIALPDGRALAAGGYRSVRGDVAKVLASTELFDPVSLTWQPGPPLKTPRYAAAIVCHRGRVLLMGGRGSMGDARPLASVESWASGEAEWTPLPKLPKPCARPRAAVLSDGSLIVVDGGAWLFRGGKWEASRGAPARTNVALTALMAGGAMVIGGNDGARDSTEVDVLEPQGRWRKGPSLPESREGAAAFELADGTLIVAGGEGTSYGTPSGEYLYEWESEFRRVSTDWDYRPRDVQDVCELEPGGVWTSQNGVEAKDAEFVRYDENRAVLSGLGYAGVYTP